MKRIAVYGCGAIGGLIAARLALSGADVTVIARGATLNALRAGGLVLTGRDGTRRECGVRASDDPAAAGPQDLVILALKAQQLPGIANRLAPLLNPETPVLTACNGVPWWHGHARAGALRAPPEVDPGERLWRAIGPARALGTVVYPAARVAAPGVIEHVAGERLPACEPGGADSARARAAAGLFAAAGFDASPRGDIYAELWAKLMANAALNPLNLVTGGPVAAILDDAARAARLEAVMAEVAAVAEAQRIALPLSPADMLRALAAVAAHRTSLLADHEAGRATELEPVSGAVQALARRLGVVTPALDILLTEARALTATG